MHLAAKRAEPGSSTLILGRPGRRSMFNPMLMEVTMVTNITPGARSAMFPICGTLFTPSRRSQRTCTEACKKKLARRQNRDVFRENGPLYQTAQNSDFGVSQVI